ncbi:FadR/GntR family transcriptional regulator [Lysinibacter sp. HNR]|uniref:FadR/GntR family transcriptional regulator n=1 Tax=Lysinibacter sp. HNR TaxID=3031408 RepID=UPI002434F20F|nr:FadR/GntR family transcriptional regulator [Lysinibacter sp. HNR]WGD38304.1 FadR/GntR family transcriptional regulator [Lysinibacter sp. HNR]
MKPIQRPTSLVDTVVNQMQREITRGAWEIGSKIPSESELTEMLGVSRSSIREGVRSLVQLGLLETRQGDGTYVIADDATRVALSRAIDHADIREVIRVRRALDVLAAHEAAASRTESDIVRLKKHLVDRADAIARGDIDGFARHDVAFHLEVVRASGNRLLVGLYASFERSLHLSVADTLEVSRRVDPDNHGFHEALCDAIAEGQPDSAGKAALGVLERQEQTLNG